MIGWLIVGGVAAVLVVVMWIGLMRNSGKLSREEEAEADRALVLGWDINVEPSRSVGVQWKRDENGNWQVDKIIDPLPHDFEDGEPHRW